MYINSEHYVEVPNDLPENKDVSALATLIYVCLLMLKTMYGYSLTSIRQMCDMISLGRIDKVYRRVRSAISELIDIGLIEIHSLEQERLEVNNITKDSSFYVTFETFDDNYFKVFIDDVNQIVRNYKKFSIMDVSNFFRYYLVIQRWTNFQDNIECRHVANSKVKFIVSDNRTIQKYNNTLQEMRIFWFENGYRSSLGLQDVE